MHGTQLRSSHVQPCHGVCGEQNALEFNACSNQYKPITSLIVAVQQFDSELILRQIIGRKNDKKIKINRKRHRCKQRKKPNENIDVLYKNGS